MRGDELRRRRRGRCLLELDVAQHAGHILTDGDQHPLEQGEGFLLVFVDRRLLRIGAQVDDLPKRIQRRQMLLPVMVERLKQDALFDLHPAFRSEEHTSELQSLMRISYAVFCLKKKTKKNTISSNN